MSAQPSPPPHNHVVVLDNSPPRGQPSLQPPSNNHVINIDAPSQSTPHSPSGLPHDAIVVDDSPRKRRRGDNNAALPPHPRTSTRSYRSPPIIVVDDDDPSSDSDAFPLPRQPPPFTPRATPSNPQPHVRLPRTNLLQPSYGTDEVIETAASGPTITRIHPGASSAPSTSTVAAASSSAPAAAAQPAPHRYTSMPPLCNTYDAANNIPQRSQHPPGLPSRLPEPLYNLRPPHGRSSSRTTPQPVARSTPSVPPASQVEHVLDAQSASLLHPFLGQPPPPLPSHTPTAPNQPYSFTDSINGARLSQSARHGLEILRAIEANGIAGLPTLSPSSPLNTNTLIRNDTASPIVVAISEDTLFLPTSTPAEQRRAGRTQRANSSRAAEPRRQSPGSVIPGTAPVPVPAVSITRIGPSSTSNAAVGMEASSGVTEFSPSMSAPRLQRRTHLHVAPSSMHASRGRTYLVAQSTTNAAQTAHPTTSARGHLATAASSRRTTNRTPSDVLQGSAGEAQTISTTRSRNADSGAIGTTASRQRRFLNSQARRNIRIQRMQRFRTTGGHFAGGIEIRYLHHLQDDRSLDYEQLIRLDEQLIRDRNRAQKNQIEALPLHIATAADCEIRCCVCMCDVEEGDELRVLPCSHKYHKKCIDEWLTYNGCCPTDKKRIAPLQPYCPRRNT